MLIGCFAESRHRVRVGDENWEAMGREGYSESFKEALFSPTCPWQILITPLLRGDEDPTLPLSFFQVEPLRPKPSTLVQHRCDDDVALPEAETQ
ncbi:hypothetical protein EVAR_36517_1 [Eumeta japonica]|uniref:Uncharacterized protein n=1 Tax=Eumeta variegata TaxID=151549 RepID=A0A4C1XA09_EUMVA|nr:hypothetical protein EVAR_36517_1 [Eumeta japonica]